MDPDSIGNLVFMFVLVLLSAYFSATETAFSSFNRIRLKSRAENGDRRAEQVIRLSENFDRLLSTILVGNNIVNILLTAQATLYFSALLGPARGVTVATVATTVVVLIFGEITPKSLAKDYAEGFVTATAPILQIIVWILYPINWLFSMWKRLINALFRPKETAAVTEEELLTIVDEAEQGGSLSEQESELIRRAISFNDREAVDILIPRVDVAGVPADATGQEMGEAFAETGFSRLPVYEDTMDHILGVVHLKDYTMAAAGNPSPADLMQPVAFVPPTVKIRLLLRQLQQDKCHMAVVSDEYGGTLGIVTMEDILEELVGEIWDEHDDVVENIRPAEDGASRVLCATELEELMEHFDAHTDCDAVTVSGWVMEALGRIPAVGDSFVTDGLAVTVTRVEKNHPEEIVVRPVSPVEN